MKISPLAGKPAPLGILVDVPRLVTAYYNGQPDPKIAAQRVAFGTSGHRGSSFNLAFNEWHILAIAQAICPYRKRQNISGPLYLGIDTHALSVPACASALEVLAANGVEVMLAEGDGYTPTPIISHAILSYNRGRKTGLSDGIVITPSHSPPPDGGFKYNPPNGGPADNVVTDWIGAKANALLEARLEGVKRLLYEKALRASTTHRRDYIGPYITDLGSIVDMDLIRHSNLRLGVDPLGGTGIHYWARIAERYGLNLTVVNEVVDPTFRFMAVDWDGQDTDGPFLDEICAITSPTSRNARTFGRDLLFPWEPRKWEEGQFRPFQPQRHSCSTGVVRPCRGRSTSAGIRTGFGMQPHGRRMANEGFTLYRIRRPLSQSEGWRPSRSRRSRFPKRVPIQARKGRSSAMSCLQRDYKLGLNYEYKYTHARTTPQDGRLLARRQLPLGRPDLSL